ncbi:MAG: type 4a pilus biogenesis protein PilO [Oryzomonas sp.]|uniref:type 4a pilus biogenesis protein PilO n=1 Tax=Oryzomonas sp. TaxID=2855186 RepID=UPI0028418D97|nr:type 4a pilus biogenesis protein PilO [Oryzomonas sp.]MDR3579324.1 type 4a pilus biogenesis protein PilO [Oryzomonas sp.]
MNQVILEIARQRRRILAVILVLLLLNCAVLVFLKEYLASAISDVQAKWSDLRRRAAVAGQNDASTIYRRGKADLEQLKAHIPHKSQFPRLLGGIFDTAASDGVKVGAVSYKPAVVKGNSALLAYGITLSVNGSYAAVKNFLADMKKSGELIVIDGMTMTNSDPYEEHVVMDLRLTVYLQEAP